MKLSADLVKHRNLNHRMVPGIEINDCTFIVFLKITGLSKLIEMLVPVVLSLLGRFWKYQASCLLGEVARS